MSPEGEKCTFFSYIFVVVAFVFLVFFCCLFVSNGLPDSRVESKAR